MAEKTNSGDVSASEEERRRRSRPPSSSGSNGDEDSSSSSSGEEEGIASPPPNKRGRYRQANTYPDPRVDSLISQVSYISGYLSQLPQLISASNSTKCTNEGSGPSEVAQQLPQTSFLVHPGTRVDNLSLGTLNTEFDAKRIVPTADKGRLEELCRLQQFDSQAWKGIRYKKSLQEYTACPGFIGLKINEELCHLNKSKDYLASTEQLLAGMSNVLLEQRQLLKKGLQDVIDWASANENKLNVSALFDKITTAFGPGSSMYKNSENLMQIVCGKRAECIEIRRDRILKEINNPNLKAMLQNVPPSSEYLFSRAALTPLIQSLGGPQTWLNTPNPVKDRRPATQTSRDQGTYKKNEQYYKSGRQEKKPKYYGNKKHSFRHNNASNGAVNNFSKKQK